MKRMFSIAVMFCALTSQAKACDPGYYCVEKAQFGRLDANPLFPDARFNWEFNRAHAELRSLQLSDIGDPPDFGLNRAGPDNGTYTSTPTPVIPGSNVGTMYGRAWGTNDSFDMDGPNGKVAGRLWQIYGRLQGEPTATSRPGSLHIGTMPPNSLNGPIDRIVIDQEGRIFLWCNNVGVIKQIFFGEANSAGPGRRAIFIEN